jgi:hypothetical protein
MNIKGNLWISAVLLLLVMGSCKKENFFTGSTTLSISADTVWFDTLFTRQAGTKYPISITRIFSIKNKENGTVKVNLSLSGGKNSPFRINADGFAGPNITDLEIPAKDSVFVFVQCSLEANNQTMPALVVDSLIATVNGNSQKTYLAAYGWDAHYYRSVQLNCNETWTDKTKPYVIIENALVAKGCTFTVKEGVTVYNSASSILIVQGTLKIEGTSSEPVNFTGDKPIFAARYLPNQWGGIYFTRGSVNNEIRFARIHNASIAVRVDSLPESGTWNLQLENSSLLYNGQAALAGITAKIRAVNCLFGESGSYSFLGLLGGTYDFKHCTFVGYNSFGPRKDGHFAITNTIRNSNGQILKSAALSCAVVNSIIYGSLKEELFVDNKGWEPFTTNITNNLIRSFDQPFASNTYNKDPLFVKTSDYNFELQAGSPALDAGIMLSPPINTDLLGKPRDSKPDLGAYEKQP